MKQNDDTAGKATLNYDVFFFFFFYYCLSHEAEFYAAVGAIDAGDENDNTENLLYWNAELNEPSSSVTDIDREGTPIRCGHKWDRER